MKKLLAVLLAIMMLLPMFSTMTFADVAVTPDANADPGSEAYTAWLKSEGYKAIGSYAELKAVTDLSASAKYYFSEDITTDGKDEYAWGDGVSFKGVLDGNGHTVYNWVRNFGEDWTGTLRNVTFSEFVAADSNEKVVRTGNGLKKNGVISGYLLDGAVIENVVNNVNFDKVNNAIGGFTYCAYKGTVTFRNCVNNGYITQNGDSNYKVGAFVSTSSTGRSVTVEFDNCVNNGNITTSQAGGFFGFIDSSIDISFKNCVNTGTIIGVVGASGYGISGGFIGCTNNKTAISNSTIKISFDNCINEGDVLRSDLAPSEKSGTAQGGLIGWIMGATELDISIIDCIVRDCEINGFNSTAEENVATIIGEAGGLAGRIVPNSANDDIVIQGCTVENVVVDAYNAARKFAFICGSADYPITLENCFANNVTQLNGNAAKIYDEEYGTYIKYNITEESSKVSINKAQQADNGDVRFIGTVDGLGYVELGYYIEYNGKTIKVTSDTVFKSLNDNYGKEKITADSLGANYLTAVKMTDVTAEFSGKINVTTYVKNADGTYEYGKTKGINFVDGIISEVSL